MQRFSIARTCVSSHVTDAFATRGPHSRVSEVQRVNILAVEEIRKSNINNSPKLSYRNVSKSKALSIKQSTGWNGLSRKNGFVAIRCCLPHVWCWESRNFCLLGFKSCQTYQNIKTAVYINSYILQSQQMVGLRYIPHVPSHSVSKKAVMFKVNCGGMFC